MLELAALHDSPYAEEWSSINGGASGSGAVTWGAGAVASIESYGAASLAALQDSPYAEEEWSALARGGGGASCSGGTTSGARAMLSYGVLLLVSSLAAFHESPYAEE